MRVLLFAAAAELAGAREIELNVSEQTTLDELSQQLRSRHPALGPLLSISRWSIDRRFAPLTSRVDASQEIALIPPVSGG